MDKPSVIVGRERPKEQHGWAGSPEMGWSALRSVAFLLVLVGATDLAFALFPPDWGNVLWRFSVGMRLVGGLPIAVLGSVLVAIAGFGLSNRRVIVVALVLNLVVAVLAAGLMFIVMASKSGAMTRLPAGQVGDFTVLRVVLLAALFCGICLTSARACLRSLGTSSNT